ncbi:MAG: Pimeloyl-ACP methyl ester carboxylesterase [Chloroflexi bacterium]|jgi:pimeloyl-ACP methyl ester carboxylesterase|nr:MAG: Pimeloyl-ACP methyl ester carboxylesterase [Chloroflexota bacterium]
MADSDPDTKETGMENPKFVDVEGIRTRYFEAGQGEPMVLISGGQFGSFNCATDWDLNFDDLAGDFHVFAVDKIGQGHTDNPKDPSDYILGTAVQHLHDFLKAVGLEQAHLVGHSRGGYAIVRLALEHPEVVKSLTIVDSGSIMHEAAPFYVELAEKAAHITDPREKHEFMMVNSSFSGTIVSDGWLDDVMSFVTTPKYRIAQETDVEMWPTCHVDHVARQKETKEWIAKGGLSDLPVLVTWAYNDQGAPIEECGIPAMHLILPSVPNSRMHIFNQSGHYVFREHPKEFNATVRTFIQGL